MKNFGLSIAGLIVAGLFLVLDGIFDWDVAEHLHAFLYRMEIIEFDEVLVALLIFLTFFAIDVARTRHAMEKEREQWRVYRATIGSVQHVMGNFLNSITYVKMTAESVEGFPKDVIETMTRDIESAQLQIKALSQLDDISSESISGSVGSRVKT